MSDTEISPFQAWILAIRPKTLPAAVAPVSVGTALAAAHDRFALFPALAALLGSLLLQIAVNLANDYFDARHGIDEGERLGPVRVTQSGLIAPTRVRGAMILTFVLAALDGVYLIIAGGWPIAAVGIAAILSALAYSGGPRPLASNALGELFAFLFFGPVAVCGTYWVQALALPSLVWTASVPVGLLIAAIMVVNNLRDIDGDRAGGKMTLAVKLGIKGSRVEYALLVALAYAIPVTTTRTGATSPWVLLTLLSLPLAGRGVASVWHDEGRRLNLTLASTARLALVFSLLFAAGILVGN